MAKTVEILVYDGMNELDFACLYEVLTSVDVIPPGGKVPQKGFHVETVADRISPIETSHGVKLFPQKGLATSVGASILIVPGGPGARRPHIPQSVIDWLTKSIENVELIAACSSGVYVLGRAGLINNRRVATHYSLTDDLHRLYPRATIVPGQRLAADGRNMLTCAGGTAALDLGLAIVNRFYGKQAMQVAANRIEYADPTAPV